MRNLVLFACIILFVVEGYAQNLPDQWRITDDNQILIAGDQSSGGIYNEAIVEDLRIYFTQPDYWSQLTNKYNSKTDIVCKIKYKDIELDSVGIRFKGQTSYFMNNSQKKSFNVSIDSYREDQKLEGYKTFNLNNAFSDPSFMREVVYYHLIRKHSPAAKANFVHLYINDQDWGIYLNVQQLNKDFLEEWYETNDGINIRADRPDGSSNGPGGQWGDGTAAINYLGQDTSKYQLYYDLKSADTGKPWVELMQACNVLNNSGDSLYKTAPKYFDIDKILWHLAAEIAFGDDDSYVYKGKMDYFIYKNAETNRWATYDYDANSTLLTEHVSWSPFYNANKVNYPLLNKLLAIPEFRQRYLAHLRTIIDDLFDESYGNALIDQYDQLIRSYVFADTKKPTSNNAYVSELTTLKNFIKNRKAFLLNQSEVKTESPSVSDASYDVNGGNSSVVQEGDKVRVSIRATHSSGIALVKVFYGTGISSTFDTLYLRDDGLMADEVAGDNKYSGYMPNFSAGTFIRYYFEARANNVEKTVKYYPSGTEHQMLIYSIQPKVIVEKTVVINEFMASNNGVVQDPMGENEDWIELYNTTDDEIDISGYYITDNPNNLTKFEIPSGVAIEAKGYLIIWADEDQEQGVTHCNFKLSAGGESITLLDPNQAIVDSVVFGAQTSDLSAARIPNGVGPFIVGNHTFNGNNDVVSSINTIPVERLKIYPNPAVNSINLTNEGQNSTTFEVVTRNGVSIIKSTLHSQESQNFHIPVPGVYFVKYGELTHKILILGQ